MKKSKAAYAPFAMALLLCLCAFAVVPGIRLLSDSGVAVDVSYPSAQLKDDTVMLTVDYDSDGSFFEIGRDIVVSTSPDFSAVLRKSGSTAENGRYIYEYPMNGTAPTTLYVKPPILYMPTEIDAFTVPLMPAGGSLSAENMGSLEKPWFTVSKVNAAEASDGVYSIRATITPNTVDLPRFPRLVVGDQVIGGAATLNFDEDGNFASGVFQYDVKADSKEAALAQVANANIVVENALLRVDSSKLRIGSSVQSVTVTVVE